MFIDKTGASTNMVQRYGWAPRSERLVQATPHGHWRTSTFLAGLRSTDLVAPLVLDGPMNGPAFLAHVEQFLAPTLQRGDVVVMDNLGTHKVAGVAEAIRAAGANVRYLSPYSPYLNPIEQAFAKLKAPLRSTASRTNETLWTTIGQLLGRFSSDEYRNYLANSEFEFTKAKCFSLTGKRSQPTDHASTLRNATTRFCHEHGELRDLLRPHRRHNQIVSASLCRFRFAKRASRLRSGSCRTRDTARSCGEHSELRRER